LRTCFVEINLKLISSDIIIDNIIFLLLIKFKTIEVLKNNQLFDILPGAMAMKHIHLDQCKRFFRLLACEMKRLQERFDAYVFHGKAAIENEFVKSAVSHN